MEIAQTRLESQYASVCGSKIHYLRAGKGDPVVFVHGIPTYSYLWRNIMPGMAGLADCVALDLIGMGKSDKPDIEYRVFNHIAYFDAFVEALNLKNITLVLHGWGSVVGFDYARRHEANIKGIAFYESHVRPTTEWEMLSLPVQQLASLLNRPGASYRAVVKQNYLINKLLPKSMLHELSQEEFDAYEAPYLTEESRKPLWQYIQDVPLGKGPSDVIQLIENYSNWLKITAIPKLMMYAIPGFITTVDTVKWARDNLSQLTMIGLDDVLHFAQESIPQAFTEHLRGWYENL